MHVPASSSELTKRKDNCNRAVNANITSRLYDCSSFMGHTVYGTQATQFTTVTATPTTTVYDKTVTVTWVESVPAQYPTTIESEVYNNNKRAGTPSCIGLSTSAPTLIPTYASACSNAARYSSACSCAGVKPATIDEGCTHPVYTQTVAAHKTITQHATSTSILIIESATSTYTTAAVETIPCGQLTQYYDGMFRHQLANFRSMSYARLCFLARFDQHLPHCRPDLCLLAERVDELPC